MTKSHSSGHETANAGSYELNRPASKARPVSRPPLPNTDDALGDITDVCALVRRQPSWIRNEVRKDKFPKPLRFGPRCSRWRMTDVKAWLLKSILAAEADTVVSEKVKARAIHASEAARRQRQAAKAAEIVTPVPVRTDATCVSNSSAGA